MITLFKNIFTDKEGTRPRIYLPIKWVKDNGTETYLLQDEDFIILLPLANKKDHEKIKAKIREII